MIHSICFEWILSVFVSIFSALHLNSSFSKCWQACYHFLGKMRALNGSSIVGRVSLSIERKPSSSNGSSVVLRWSENTLAALQKVVAECGKPKELLTSTSLSTTKGLKSHSTQGYTLCLEILPTIMANPGQ